MAFLPSWTNHRPIGKMNRDMAEEGDPMKKNVLPLALALSLLLLAAARARAEGATRSGFIPDGGSGCTAAGEDFRAFLADNAPGAPPCGGWRSCQDEG